MNSMPLLDWGNGDPQVLRDVYIQDRRAIADQVAPDVAIESYDTITGASLWFKTESPSGAPILYFHGGGWVAGSPQTHVTLCSWMALLTNRRVLSVPYGLCPDFKFPSQLHDAARAVDDFLRDEDRCIVAGDSAGGAMALWAESHAIARDRVAGAISLYGAFGAMDTPSMLTANEGLKRQDMVGMYDRLGTPMGQGILGAVRPDGAKTLLVTAGADALADDHKLLLNHLDRDVTEITADNQPHAFLQYCGSNAAAHDTMVQVAKMTATWS